MYEEMSLICVISLQGGYRTSSLGRSEWTAEERSWICSLNWIYYSSQIVHSGIGTYVYKLAPLSDCHGFVLSWWFTNGKALCWCIPAYLVLCLTWITLEYGWCLVLHWHFRNGDQVILTGWSSWAWSSTVKSHCCDMAPRRHSDSLNSDVIPDSRHCPEDCNTTALPWRLHFFR